MQQTKTARIPGPDHPIAITLSDNRVVVRVAGRVIIETRASLVLKEASYPPVYYLPRADADMTQLTRTDHSTYCPYKGDCSYYSIQPGAERSKNAVWTYEYPYPAVAQIKGYLAFYPDRVESIEILPPL
jgi:uncharacterized protein (DUF427 family)